MARNKARILYILLVLSAGASEANQPAADSTHAAAEAGLQWARSYQDVFRVAEAEGSPVMLFFSASWCPWCDKMESETFSHGDVLSRLRRFTCLKIDVEKDRDLALAYGISSLPRTFVINTHGEMVGDWLGYRDAEQFLELLDQIEPYIATAAGVRKIPEIAPIPGAPVFSVRSPSIETADPNQCTELLGDKDRSVRQRVIAFLSRSSPIGLPIALGALEHDYLGIRIAAWKVIRSLKVTDLEFDPWAPQAERQEAARKLREQISAASKRSN